MIPTRVAQRAATRYIEAGSCWISTYSVGTHGYAQVGCSLDGKTYMTVAHRAAWQHHYGPIPEGVTVDHLCHVRTCVNPLHLRLLSNSDNGKRNGIGRDFPLGQSCRRGHSPERRRLRKTGSTVCLDCVAIARKKYEMKQRAS